MVLSFKITPWKQLKHQGKTLINIDKYKMNFVTNKKLTNVLGASSMNAKRAKRLSYIPLLQNVDLFSYIIM